jgi:hypothetical protein
MATEKRRSNREAKKPKQAKPNRIAAVSPTPPLALAVRDGAAVGGRDRPVGRNGRR